MTTAFGKGLRQPIARVARPVVAVICTRGDARALSAVMRGMRGVRYPIVSTREHLREAMGWLCAAQDAAAGGGVSAYYDLARARWAPAYPETTGYIIPTFFEYAERSGDDHYRARAIRMADWLLTLQLENGAFPIGPLWPHWNRDPIVFDTGQIVHGLVRAFEETDDARYLEAARRAGDWLAEVQEPEGSWSRFDYRQEPHSYSARVAWALLRLYEVAPVDRYRETAARNLAWTRKQQRRDGWFANAGFTPDQDPLTHTIAYTIRGLLEGGILLSNDDLIASARLAADALKARQSVEGYLKGAYGPGWVPRVSWSCLTGDVQTAQIWLRLFQLTDDEGYLEAAVRANDYVRQAQARGTGIVGIDGGIAGSYPIQGDYQSFQIVNWAAKFFVDSLMLEEMVGRRSGVEQPAASSKPG